MGDSSHFVTNLPTQKKNTSTSLQMMKARHESEIVKLGHDIDEEETKLELLRRQYRSIMGKKDILSAHLLASDIDHKRMQTAIQNKLVETCGVMNQYQTFLFLEPALY